MADPFQLCGVGGDYVDKKIVNFQILNRVGMKEISIVIFYAVSNQDQETSTTGFGMYIFVHYVYHSSK
jgi:hypothetical protein